jgi:biotin operon repressor
MVEVTFLTIHARTLVCIDQDPDVRRREIASTLNITERSVWKIVDDLISGGYVVKEKDGRRNRYHVQADAPLGEAIGRQKTMGGLLKALVGSSTRGRQRPKRSRWAGSVRLREPKKSSLSLNQSP